MSQPIAVMIVDDHQLVRLGLRTLFEDLDEFEIVAEADGGKSAIELAVKSRPNVILMDLVMPEVPGIDAIRAIKSILPTSHIIALSSFGRSDLIRDALKAGAEGYILKNVSADDLTKAVLDAYYGRMTIAPEITQKLIEDIKTSTSDYQLTSREKDVLMLMVEGLSNPDIAETLVISLSTVKTHVSNIFCKLNVSSRTEAVKIALEKKLF